MHRELIKRLSWREISGRYKGSLIGLGWSIVQPVLMLSVYTVVFSGIFKSRWGQQELSGLLFAANLFAGLLAFNLVAECATRGPNLIIAEPNYVKKVIFPIEILPAVSVVTALFHATTGVAILVVAMTLGGNPLHGVAILLPLVWMPLVMGCLSISWLLSALGVYIRDLQQVAGVTVNMLLFVSAVFYPITAMPAKWQLLLNINPLLHSIEATRSLLINGEAPEPIWWAVNTTIALICCQFSYRVFEKARRGFADVM